MNRSQSIREVAASLSRELSQGPLRKHRAVRAFGGLLVALAIIALISSVSGAGSYRTQPTSPVRPISKPLSSYQSDLVEIPNPIDNSQNQVVTGNVTSGKHFRGAVPYSSPKSIQAPLGSTSLNSFMRYTTPSDTSERISSKYDSYYSSTGTASAIEPGRKSIAVPGRSTIAPDFANRGAGMTTSAPRLGIYSQIQGTDDETLTLGDAALEASRRLRSLSSSHPLDEKGIRPRSGLGDPTSASLAGPPLTDEAYRQQIKELQDRLSTVVAEITQLEQSLQSQESQKSESTTESTKQAASVAQETRSALDANISRRDELLRQTARLLAATKDTTHRDPANPSESPESSASQTNVPRLRLYQADSNASESTETVSTAKSSPIDSLFLPMARMTGPTQLSDKPATQEVRETLPALDRSMAPVAAQWESPQPVKPNAIEVVNPAPSKAAQTPAAESKRNPNALAALSPAAQEEFEGLLKAGQEYLKLGQFHRAADSFALAAAYKPNDPRIHLGKSQALFAAGEYASSAFFLGKAVELDVQGALQKVDMVKIAGGADAYLARFGELAQSAKSGGIPQLQFLLAYIYYQQDAPREMTQAAIDRAWKKLPSSASVRAFRKAIYSR